MEYIPIEERVERLEKQIVSIVSMLDRLAEMKQEQLVVTIKLAIETYRSQFAMLKAIAANSGVLTPQQRAEQIANCDKMIADFEAQTNKMMADPNFQDLTALEKIIPRLPPGFLPPLST